MQNEWIQRLNLLIYAVEHHDCDKFMSLVTVDRSNGIIRDNIYNGSNALHVFMCCPTQVAINPDTVARIKVIKQLLEWKVDINSQDDSGHTPLYSAVCNGDVAIIPFLLENGANRRIKVTPVAGNGTASATSFAGFIESRSGEIPMTKIFMLDGAHIDEFFEDAPEAHARFPRNPIMVKFYECILRARQIATILMGMHKYKRSPPVLICGKDCISLIARIVYTTRGDPIWTQQTHLESKI